MTEQISYLHTENTTSWHRERMLLMLYMPALSRGFILLFVFSFLLPLVASSIAKFTGNIPEKLLTWPLTALLYLSPIILTRRDYRSICAQLPVTAGEKLGFLLIIFWIVWPVTMIVSFTIGCALSDLIFNVDICGFISKVGELQTKDYPSIFILPIFFTSISSIILYYTVTAKNNRALASFVSLFVTLIILMLLGAIGGIIIGIFFATTEEIPTNAADEMPQILAEVMPVLISIVAALLAAAGITYLYRLYKYLRNGGF